MKFECLWLNDMNINMDTDYIQIMDKLGDSLEQLFTSCGRKFSIRCVCAIAIQILSRIEELHKHNYLHRDIKPDNFLIGHTQNGDLQSKEAGKIYMIDLGLGKVWKEGGRHIPEKHGKRLIGTPRYASINTHFGHGLFCFVLSILYDIICKMHIYLHCSFT